VLSTDNVAPMVTKNHRHSMSQPERAKWWEAFLLPLNHYPNTLEEAVKARAHFADLAIEEYRQRITWRNTHDQ
jgi:hypothetical protein